MKTNKKSNSKNRKEKTMKKCPICGSEAKFVNAAEYYATQVGTFAVCAGGGVLVSTIAPAPCRCPMCIYGMAKSHQRHEKKI